MPDQQEQSRPAAPGKPLWRRAYDAVEKQAAPPLEAAVRTATFADAASLAVKLQSRMRRTLAHRTAQLLHLVNLPAASDIARLREQVALLDHELRRLGHEMSDAAETRSANAGRAGAGRTAHRPGPGPARSPETGAAQPEDGETGDRQPALAASDPEPDNSRTEDPDAHPAEP